MIKTHTTHEAPRQEAALPPALANINTDVLDDAILKKLVDPKIYYAFARCRATGLAKDKEEVNGLAKLPTPLRLRNGRPSS